jgi:hypothetical protein
MALPVKGTVVLWTPFAPAASAGASEGIGGAGLPSEDIDGCGGAGGIEGFPAAGMEERNMQF